jgi:tetratricopeptide (TPR) repeat protein
MNEFFGSPAAPRGPRAARTVVKLSAGAVLLGAGLLPHAGCNKAGDTAVPAASQPAATAGANKPGPAAASPKETWDALILQAQADLEAGKLDDAQQKLADLGKVYAPPAKPDEAQQKALAALTKQVQDKRMAGLATERAAKLAAAQALFKEGKYTEADEAVKLVLTLAPTVEQASAAESLASAIGQYRAARRQLDSSMRFLASDESSQISAARLELSKRPDDALPLLVEASADATKPKLVQRALAIMVQLDRPKLSIPAMVAVLKRPEQKENWPDAIHALERVNKPGAGEPLLELATTGATPESRIAALTALSKVVDTPPRTAVALLPLAADNGPVLAPALAAIAHAVQTLDQTDLASRRNLESLTPEDEQRLDALPDRLLKLAAGKEEGVSPEAVQNAKGLAVALQLIQPEPLKGVKVLRTSSATPESPADAAVDGVWNSIEPASQWCYPATGRGTIMLDLGEERTVTGVRVWNLNTANAVTLGWKEVRVMVSSDPSEVRPARMGQVPPAPAAANTTDYSVLIPTGIQRGRYVEIAAISLWGAAEGNSGLAEVQVLGF